MNRTVSKSSMSSRSAWLKKAGLPLLMSAALCSFGWVNRADAQTDGHQCNCSASITADTGVSSEMQTLEYSDCAYDQPDCQSLCESAFINTPGVSSSSQISAQYCDSPQCAMSCSRLKGEAAKFGGSEATKGQVTQPFKQYSLQNPLAAKSVPDLIGRVARILMGLVGTFALLMFVYGSFLWLTSQGNPEQVQKGKQVFTWAVIGLIVVFSAYIVLRQVFVTIGASD